MQVIHARGMKNALSRTSISLFLQFIVAMPDARIERARAATHNL